MPRKPKRPYHRKEVDQQMNELMDVVVRCWKENEKPTISGIAEELELSPAKVRKLLVTAGVRDRTVYYYSEVAAKVLSLYQSHVSLQEIQKQTGLSAKSVQGYLPYSKIVYGLGSISAEAERIRLFRLRESALVELREHLKAEDISEYLWRAVIVFEGYTFTTNGRGKDKTGAISFRYSVSRSTGASGRHFKGTVVQGFGNELFIEGKYKSVSRSTVDLALQNALEVQKREGYVSGPRKLGVPGVRSNLYSMFLRFGIISDSKTDNPDSKANSLE